MVLGQSFLAAAGFVIRGTASTCLRAPLVVTVKRFHSILLSMQKSSLALQISRIFILTSALAHERTGLFLNMQRRVKGVEVP